MADDQAPANEASPVDTSSVQAEPSSALDNPENLNFEDPLEEDTPEVKAEGTEPDSETDAPIEDGQEADESADESETEEGSEPSAIKDDVVVDVAGEKLPLSELKAGYQRQADYTRKTQELGNKRRDLESLSTRVNNSVNAIADLLVSQIPPAPDASLAMTNPGKYVADKAMHDAMMAQVASVIEQAQAPKEAVSKLSDEQRSEMLQSENAKLLEAFPSLSKPEQRKKFFDDAVSVAKDLGYSDEEIKASTDHRMYKLAHYARLGMAAEKAKAKAVAKVVNVPPVAPTKRPAGPNVAKQRANQDAMKRLVSSGSIHDAMDIDF